MTCDKPIELCWVQRERRTLAMILTGCFWLCAPLLTQTERGPGEVSVTWKRRHPPPFRILYLTFLVGSCVNHSSLYVFNINMVLLYTRLLLLPRLACTLGGAISGLGQSFIKYKIESLLFLFSIFVSLFFSICIDTIWNHHRCPFSNPKETL